MVMMAFGCAGPRPAFEESLKRYSDTLDAQKLRHSALHFLVSQYAKETLRNSPERRLLAELDSMDIHLSRDSARAEQIYLLALRELDPDKLTPENEFETQLQERLNWIVTVGKCWYPDNSLTLQFDELAQDVLLFGVPTSEQRGDYGEDAPDAWREILTVDFPQVGNLERRYERTARRGLQWQRIPTLKQIDDAKGYYLGTTRRGAKEQDYTKALMLRQNAEESGKIYTAVTYVPLNPDHVMAEVVPLPGPGPGGEISAQYGWKPWNTYAAVVNVAVKAQPFIHVDSTGAVNATIRLKYTVMDPVDRRTLDSGTATTVVPGDSGIDVNSKITLQRVTDWFHHVESLKTERGGGADEHDYLLGLRLETPGGKAWEESYHLTVPVRYPLTPVFQGMLVAQPRGKNEYLNIPAPNLTRTVAPRDTLLVWLPVTMPPCGPEIDRYRGHATVYLIPKSRLHGYVRTGRAIPTEQVDLNIIAQEHPGTRRGIFVDVKTISSPMPSSYQVLPVVLPRVPDGPYTLAILVHADQAPTGKEEYHRVPTAATFLDLVVKR